VLSDRREQQAVVTFIAIARITSAALLGTVMAVYIGEIASEFYVSLALAVFHFGLLFAAPFWGAVADVTGRRRAVLFGTLLLSAVALLPLAFTQTLWAQLGVRGLYAVFAAGFGPTMLAIVSNRGGDESRGRSIGFYNSALSVGDISGRLASGYVLGFLLPGETYLLVAALGAVAALGVVALTDPTPSPDVNPTLRELLSEVRSRLLPAVGDRDHLRTNGLQYLYVALALRNMTQKGMSSIMPVFLIGALGASEPTMGALLAVSPTLRTGAMYALGRVSDRVGRKPLITAGLVGAGLQALLLAVALGLPDVTSRIAVAALAFVVHAVTFSALTTGTIAFIGDVAPVDRESELMGLRTTTRGVGGVVGPLLVGAAADVWGWGVAFGASSVLAFGAAGLVAWRLVESHGSTGAVAGAAD